jgi:hypothetical protein
LWWSHRVWSRCQYVVTLTHRVCALCWSHTGNSELLFTKFVHWKFQMVQNNFG